MGNFVAEGECTADDPCQACENGIGHAPVLSFYEPAEGCYILRAEESEYYCTARYTSAGAGSREAGDICGAPAEEWAGDVALCAHHFKRQMQWWEDRARREWIDLYKYQAQLHRQQMKYDQRRNKQQVALAEKRLAAEAAAKSRHSVVYYIRRLSDGAVKIGFSASLEDRTAALRGQHGPLETLLVLGGARPEEADAHGKWGKYRLGRTEWFCPARPLLEWICQARRSHPHPHIQPKGILSLPKLKKLALAAPSDADLEWPENGSVQWPPRIAAA